MTLVSLVSDPDGLREQAVASHFQWTQLGFPGLLSRGSKLRKCREHPTSQALCPATGPLRGSTAHTKPLESLPWFLHLGLPLPGW